MKNKVIALFLITIMTLCMTSAAMASEPVPAGTGGPVVIKPTNDYPSKPITPPSK